MSALAEFDTIARQAPPNRRTSPRLEVVGQLFGQLVILNVPIAVRDVGPAGFATESTVPFPVGADHLFRFTTAAGLQVLVRATVRHSHSTISDDGAEQFVTGFEFIHDTIHDTTADIGILLDAMTDALEFDSIA